MAHCENYKILRKIGTGGFADVFLAQNEDDGSIWALKVIVKNSDFNYEFHSFIVKEILIMKELNHKHILNITNANMNAVYRKVSGESYEVWFMALELASWGDLFDYMLLTSPFSEDLARYYMLQIIDAFDYMNQKGISHRDLKPENLLIDQDFNIKISDFGWATK